MQSLAGNAFETSCCLATLVCTLAVLAQPHRPPLLPRQLHVIVAEDGDDDDHDGLSDVIDELFAPRIRRRRLC